MGIPGRGGAKNAALECRERELPETPELLERRERQRAAQQERQRRWRKKERELPEAVRGPDSASGRQVGVRGPVVSQTPSLTSRQDSAPHSLAT